MQKTAKPPKSANPIKPFAYKDLSKKQFADGIDEEFKLDLRYNEDLINRICNRYPFTSKLNVITVVQLFFLCFRRMVLMGKIFSITRYMRSINLYITNVSKDSLKAPACKVRLTTPKHIKYCIKYPQGNKNV